MVYLMTSSLRKVKALIWFNLFCNTEKNSPILFAPNNEFKLCNGATTTKRHC
jgi:hypothetical protein